MRTAVLAIALLLLATACSAPDEPTRAVLGTQDLIFTAADLQALGMTSGGCVTESYETGEFSPLAQYSMCNYTIDVDGTEVIMELRKFTNFNDLNGTYQYSSLHLRGAKGLLGENEYGDLSRFFVNNEDDYGAEFNPPGVYFYHLWIVKDPYLILVTSKGSEGARDVIADAGRTLMAKFD